MVIVLIVPTGLDAPIGGDAGDANPVAKMLAGCCDTLITHPNVVNASDINEMTENTLYVDGYMLDEFLLGRTHLDPVRTYNKILVVYNPPKSLAEKVETINAVNAARVTIGTDIEILELNESLLMFSVIKGRVAGGFAKGVESLVKQVKGRDFDALAIHTSITVNRDVALNYYKNGGVNPWGGVEASTSREIARQLRRPVAHAPLENACPNDEELYNVFSEEVPPRIAPEAISRCYFHCVLKGLHRAPRYSEYGLSVKDVDVLVSPYGCWGIPHKACETAGISVIYVEENTIPWGPLNETGILVRNYWEAAGYLMCLKAGVRPQAVRI